MYLSILMLIVRENIPDDIINNIKSFLVKCECCQRFYDKKNAKICTTCNRSWCIKCCENQNYIGFNYYQLFIMTCKHCAVEYRLPKLI